MTPVINTSRHQRRLQQAFGLEGHPPAPTLAPEIVPVTLVEDLSPTAGSGEPGAPGAGIPVLDPSDPFTARQFEKWHTAPAAGAGTYASITFVNPRDSGVIAMLTQWTGTSSTDFTQSPFVATSTILAPSIAERGYLRDTRLLAPGVDSLLTNVSQCGMVAASSGVAPTANRPGIKTGPAGVSNTPGDIRYIGYILRPNSHIVFRGTGANQPIWLGIIWSERQVLPGEADGRG